MALMVPPSRAPAPPPVRFPRVRGDGPSRREGQSIGKVVPPRPRGWSPVEPMVALFQQGSPASAGMVPPRSKTSWSLVGFPRVRGDGPDLFAVVLLGSTVPPRPRGWSQLLVACPRFVSGSPASAGMVPLTISCRYFSRRFPRVRGDGPEAASSPVPMPTVPPRPRGWSQRRETEAPEGVGSPASAGMVPFWPIWDFDRLGFPRVRGDGPCPADCIEQGKLVPPRPRGWSLRRLLYLSRWRGSPASAGMVPSHAPPGCHKDWFPRVRGDGPYLKALRMDIPKVPPRPRGWSLCGAWAGALGVGSPASAGMVPTSPRALSRVPRFPRVRGDGPAVGIQSQNASTVPPRPRGWSPDLCDSAARTSGSPASAGMVPFRPRIYSWSQRFPRVRGDGPHGFDPTWMPSQVPPRPRGWSPPARLRAQLIPGSPASAGMVLCRASGRGIRRRFPRVRGDGPGTGRRGHGPKMVPPRPRGWSLHRASDGAGGLGSPASAGMVPSPKS